MRVPLNVWDYLERAAYVHSGRVAVVDEPNVLGTLGQVTYAQLQARARGMALALDRHGRGARRAGRDRQPQRGPASSSPSSA